MFSICPAALHSDFPGAENFVKPDSITVRNNSSAKKLYPPAVMKITGKAHINMEYIAAEPEIIVFEAEAIIPTSDGTKILQ